MAQLITLNRIHKAYAARLRSQDFKGAKAMARQYNALLEAMGGPKRVQGEYYLQIELTN